MILTDMAYTRRAPTHTSFCVMLMTGYGSMCVMFVYVGGNSCGSLLSYSDKEGFGLDREEG